MRTPIIAGNWKMHKTADESVAFVQALAPALAPYSSVERVVCPTFVALVGVAEALRGTGIKVSAQNVSAAVAGAYTSQIAVGMLEGLAEYVLIGHSEVRQYLGETDEDINLKAKLLIEYGFKPIIAVGESYEINQANQTANHVEAQIRAAFEGIYLDKLAHIVVAYEPIWAIGTGLNASPEFAQDVIGGTIRGTLSSLYGAEGAHQVRVQYGGSVKPGNMADYMSQPDIDGALVGGASLNVDDFTALVRIAAEVKGA
ncbi:MAG TPA: triose-phosphate isomerase [Candidatus Limnocylindrales bacterium]|nr:triose-phosphate isomerase [Candidatus Limnocylindrales bacterium]